MPGFVIVSLIGLGFGIGGLFQDGSGKGFAVAGIVLNVMHVCGMVSLVALTFVLVDNGY